MPARVALSSVGQNGQYVGTTRVPTPTASPGSATCRNFNGTSDRLVLGQGNSLGANFLALMTFWRADGSVLADNSTAARLFTQYCVGGTRVAAGLNRSFLSLTYTDSSGNTVTVETKVRVLDTARHFLALEVTATAIRLFLDGRLAAKVTATLAAPDLARVCIAADANSRFFRGQIDDLAIFQTYPGKTQNWLRYYRELVRGNFSRDYQAAAFGTGYNAVTLTEDGYSASGFTVAPSSRVPLAHPLRTEAELAQQFLEFRFSVGGTGTMRLGVFNTSHDLAADDIGDSPNSYAFTADGLVLHDSDSIYESVPVWGENNIVALGWTPATSKLALWIDGEHQWEITLPAGTWTPAISLGAHTVFLNSGQSVPLSLPTDTPGLPSKVWSKLTTEFRQMKLAEVNAPLDDADEIVRDAYSDAAVGLYTTPLPLEPGFTVDSFDFSRRVGGGIKINFGPYSAADDDFFFAIAFSPDAADLTGEVVLLESPTKWGLRIIDGRLNAWVGDVQVGSVNEPFTPGERYILGITRSGTGKLLVWTYIGYVLQSGDNTVAQTATDVWVGSAADGSKAFAGRLSHLVLSSKLPAAWKMNRLKSVYTWDLPDIAGMIPNPADVRQVFELSWRDVIALGISATPTATHCYVGTVGKQPDAIAIEYRPVDRENAGSFTGTEISSWAPVGTLLQYTDKVTDQFLLASAADLDTVTVGTALLVGEEICKVTAINLTLLIVTVERACADTSPAVHGAGSLVWFYDGHLGSARNNYEVLDSVDVKMLSRSSLAEMGEEFAPTDTVAMRGRLARPYPPANVRINEQYSPEALTGTVYIQWNHRNKAVQGSTLTGWYVPGAFTAPAGVTYLVRAYNADTGELVHESSAIPGTDTDYNLYIQNYLGNLRVDLMSVSGGVECLFIPSLEFAYDAEVTTLITTEEEEPLSTEDGEGAIEAERMTRLLANSFSGELPDDWEGFEEEEEEEEGQFLGTPISEFPPLPLTPTGDEIIPVVINGTNYSITFTRYLEWLLGNIPAAADGKDAYELWLEEGNVGSLEDFFEAYRGYRGLNSNQARRIQTITSASGAIICNWENYDEIRLRLTGDVILTFQGPKDGQGCLLKITQDSVGSHGVTLPASVRYNNLVQGYTPTPTPGLSDKVGFIYDSGDATYDFVTFVPGFSS